MKKKLLVVLAAGIMGASLLAGCGENNTSSETKAVQEKAAEEKTETEPGTGQSKEASDDKVIGMSLMAFNHPFMQDIMKSAMYTAEEAGYTVSAVDANWDAATQQQGLEDLISSGKMKALFVNAVDGDAIVPVVEEANKAGIPVITVDTKSNGGDVFAHAASDSKEIGKMAGEYAAKLLKEKNGSEKGKTIVINYPQVTSMAERVSGFKEELSQYPEIEIIEKNVLELTPESAQALMDDLIQTYPEGSFDLLFAANATTGVGANAVTESANRTDYLVIAVDDDPELIAALQRGKQFKGMVVQDGIDIGKKGMELCIAGAEGKTAEEKIVATRISLVTNENLEEYQKEYAERQKVIESYGQK
ncbi:substrate-binding domain-containing protein [Robinsoniella sp. KNHs210]|uniref:sugar ABC transporter substrate-binding protein n=1 Tax=Robinsoniella TaxID=588605 RepID=UPI00048377CC|nr:substrate-binding domain-containing protein [Robinsoniella sp. KNHs210]MDU7029184.1 substrate-binding domain-containing protein [Clostridiales bacterium]